MRNRSTVVDKCNESERYYNTYRHSVVLIILDTIWCLSDSIYTRTRKIVIYT